MNGELSSNQRQLGRATDPSAAATVTGNRKAIGRSNATSGGMAMHQALPSRRHGYPDYSNQLSATRLPMISPISTMVNGLASSASTLMSGTDHRSTSGESHSSRMMPPPQLSTPQSSVTSQQQQRTGYGSSVSDKCGQGAMSITRGLTSCGFNFKTENETMGLTKPVVTQPPHGISPSSLSQHQRHSMNGSNDHVIAVTDSSHRRLSGGVQPEVGFGDMEGAETGLLDTKADGRWSLVGSQPALPSSTTTQSASRVFNNVTRCSEYQQFPQSMIFVVPPGLPAPRSAAMTSIFGPGASPIQSARGGGKKRAMSSSTRSSDALCDVLSITRMSPTALIWGDDYSETQNHYQHQQQYQHGTTRCYNGFLSGNGEVGHNIMSARGSMFSESSLASASVNFRQRAQRQIISSVCGSVRRGQRPGNSSSFGGEDDNESYISISDSMMLLERGGLERGGLERGGRYDEMQQPISSETAPSNRIVFESSVKLCGGGQVTINKTPYAEESEFDDERIDGYPHRRLPPSYDAACGASRTGDMLSAVDPTFDDEQFPDIEQQYSQLDQLSNEFGSATWTEDSASTSSGYPPQYVCRWRDCDQLFHCQDELVQHLEREHVDQRSASIATMIPPPGVTIASGPVGDEFTCMWDGCKRQTKPFNARYKLLIHLRVHSGEKPHRCTADGCDKSFSRLENLKIHMRSHTGERPYICSHIGCNKAFSNSSDRAKHQRTHVDTKPYACQVPNCDKRYTDPSSLRKHLKIHTAGGLQHLKKKVRTDSSDDCSTPTSAAGGASSTDSAALNNLLSVHSVVTCTQQQQQQLQQQQQQYPTGMLFGQAMLDGFSSQSASNHSSDLQSTSNKHHPSLPVSMGLTEHRQIVGGGFNSQSNGSLLTAARHRPSGSSRPNLGVSGTGRSLSLGPAVQVRRIRQNVPPPPYPSATAAEPENDQMWINNVAQQNSGIIDQRSPANSESSSSNAAPNFQPGTSATPGAEFGQGEYPKFPVYGSTSIRYIEQLYANDPPAFVPSSASSSSVPTLPPLRRTSSCLQPPAYYQPMHQFAEYMPCNIQQRMAYGSGAFNSTGGATSLYPQLLPDSLEQTLAGLPSDAIQLNDFADYQGFTDFTASTVQEQDYLTVYNG